MRTSKPESTHIVCQNTENSRLQLIKYCAVGLNPLEEVFISDP